jgi:hypothetical protein
MYVYIYINTPTCIYTGLITWDGAVVLAKYLECHPSLVYERNVLEVGAGIVRIYPYSISKQMLR